MHTLSRPVSNAMHSHAKNNRIHGYCSGPGIERVIIVGSGYDFIFHLSLRSSAPASLSCYVHLTATCQAHMNFLSVTL